MSAKKIRHPAVYYVKPEERTVTDKAAGKQRTKRTAAAMKWRDPMSGKWTRRKFTAAEGRTAETRARAMRRQSIENAKKLADIEAGKVKPDTGTTIADAVAFYFESNPQHRPATVTELRRATDRLAAWADSAGIESVDEITRGALVKFAGVVKNAPKRRAVKGGSVGQYGARDRRERRAPSTINGELTAAGTVLLWLRDADLLPKATPEDISRGLKKIPGEQDEPDPLQPSEVREVLRAAVQRDADLAARARRGERVGPPIAGFTAYVLLTGIRAAQARALTWDRVNFDGRMTIRITKASKTKRARTMLFDDVSPKLRELLQAQADVTGGKSGNVWGLTHAQIERAREKLIEAPGPKKRGKGMKAAYGAPAFDWQRLRVTSRSAAGAAQLMDPDRLERHYGHRSRVAFEHYAGLMPTVSRHAESIEDALGIVAQLDEIVAATKARSRGWLRAVG